MAKSDIIKTLQDAGIAHDPTAPVTELKALIPDAPVAPVAEKKSDRQARWDAFLVEARKVNPEMFDARKEKGEFDTIPESWIA